MSLKFSLAPLDLQEFELSNGLRVVLNKDDAIPVVAVAVYYDVGSRNEREGRTVLAHLFEHMMFQGSENVPKAAHFQYIMKAGGTMNGTTSSERTNYYETLPDNQLPLALSVITPSSGKRAFSACTARDQPVGIPRLLGAGGLAVSVDHGEKRERGPPSSIASSATGSGRSSDTRSTPGMDATASVRPAPSSTNTG